MLNRIKFDTFAYPNDALDFYAWPYFSEDEIAKVTQILRSGRVNYWTGDEGQLFEKEYAAFIGTPYAVALMNGSVALEAALAALNIGPDDDVITTCRTFIASASCIILRGANPIFADVDLTSQNLTAESIEKVITPNTKAIIVVHLAGWPCEMEDIQKIARKYDLYIIEDCAQAHGAMINNQLVGSFGDVAAFSFCQDKIMTTAGEGGMITTHHKKIWEKIWALKDHGKSYHAVFEQKNLPGFRWLHDSFGTNWRMTEIQAAIGRIQLTKINHWITLRQRNANILTQNFQQIDGLRVTQPKHSICHAYYKYYVFLQLEKLKKDWTRDRIMQAINAKGVPCFSGICSEIHLEKAFLKHCLVPVGRFPIAKNLGESSLMFLVDPTLTEEHMLRTVHVVNEIMHLAIK